MNALEVAALEYVKARNERKQAKQALREWFHRYDEGGEVYPCNHGDVGCFRSYDEHGREIPKDEWCDLCKEKQPIYDAYQAAQRKQGQTLRRLDRIANKALKEPTP